MAYEIITIPFNSSDKLFYAEALNKFCLNKQILRKDIKFFQDAKNVYWTVFIEYEVVLEHKTDCSKGLTEAGRLCFERLREWRKIRAEKEGIPPFVIAKNSHFIEVINKEIKTLENLKQIKGFGRKKLDKYGKDITDIIKTFYEASNER